MTIKKAHACDAATYLEMDATSVLQGHMHATQPYKFPTDPNPLNEPPHRYFTYKSIQWAPLLNSNH